jgi:imidazolonepropionase-like amidohydrolase
MRDGRKLLILCVAILLSAAVGPAQQPAGKTFVLKAARLFDGKSNSLVTPGMVVVADGKITGVGGSAAIPAGAEVIDLGDATLLPGFIDAHTHETMMNSNDWKQRELDGLQKTIAEQTLDATANVRITLMAGFTTVRDVGSHDFIDVGMRNAIRNGLVPGPRMIVSAYAIGSTGGHCDNSAGYRQGLFGHETGPSEGVINGADQARQAVRLMHKYGATVIKTCASGGVLSPTDDVDTTARKLRNAPFAPE